MRRLRLLEALEQSGERLDLGGRERRLIDRYFRNRLAFAFALDAGRDANEFQEQPRVDADRKRRPSAAAVVQSSRQLDETGTAPIGAERGDRALPPVGERQGVSQELPERKPRQHDRFVEEHARRTHSRMRGLPSAIDRGAFVFEPLSQRRCQRGGIGFVVRGEKQFNAIGRGASVHNPDVGQDRKVLGESPLLLRPSVEQLFDAVSLH